jgi:hypothetical protein
VLVDSEIKHITVLLGLQTLASRTSATPYS